MLSNRPARAAARFSSIAASALARPASAVTTSESSLSRQRNCAGNRRLSRAAAAVVSSRARSQFVASRRSAQATRASSRASSPRTNAAWARVVSRLTCP